MHKNPAGLKVGVVGLGQMGRPMAANLLRKGFSPFGYDVHAPALESAVRAGLRAADSPLEVLRQADVVILSLPTEAVLEQVMLGPQGLAGASVRGKILVDTTTTTVSLAQDLAKAVASHGGTFLDAPVTGGSAGAEAGTLTFMVGGEGADFERVRPVLNALGATLVHAGGSGQGQAAKMVNQMLMAAIYVSVAESFAFAVQLGADISKVYAAVENGGGQSRLLGSIKEYMLSGRTRENGNIDQHGKDIDYVMAEANRRHLTLPLTSQVHEFYNLSRTLGYGRVWSGDMWAVWEKILGIKFTNTITSVPRGKSE